MSVDPVLIGAGVCAAGAAAMAVAALRVMRPRPPGAVRRSAVRLAAGGTGLLVALLLLGAAALCAMLAVGLQGYRALTREDLAVTVHTRPLGPQRFEARFVFPDGREVRYALAGDQLAVEARILKWHPWANLLGLHTAYELDRVTGRYGRLEDEQQRPRTVFALGTQRPIDLFAWRQRVSWLAPIVDAEYGSGTFTGAQRAASYEVRVSTSGLLVREVR